MNRQSKEYTIWDAKTPVAITSSTDATPIVVTATSHGFSNGDMVMINGHTTNIAANGTYIVAAVTANTFALTDRYTGANIAGTGGGAGASGVVIAAPKIPLVTDFKSIELQVSTSGTATTTIKIAGSLGKTLVNTSTHGDCPNFGATIAVSNPYQFLQIINLASGASVAGATGIAVAGTDIHNLYEINTNGMKFVAPIVVSWTQGAITMKLIGYYF